MANLAVGDLCQVAFIMRADDQVGINLRHFRVTGVSGVGMTDQQMADNLEALMAPLYKPLIGNEAEWKGVELKRISPLPAPNLVFSIANAGAGTGGASLMGRQMAGVVGFQSVLAGPANRGRIYVPFPSTTMTTTDGHPSLAYKANLSLLAAEITGAKVKGTAPNTVNIIWCIRHAPGFTTTDLVTYQVRGSWGTQKRRGDYGRPNPL